MAQEATTIQGPDLSVTIDRALFEVLDNHNLEGSGLGVREVPTTERGRACVDGLLDAACVLLSRDGVRNVTTNHIAEQAGVSIATVYRYFADFESLFETLLVRRLSCEIEILRKLLINLGSGQRWRCWTDHCLGIFVQRLDSDLFSVVRSARAIPSTYEIPEQSFNICADLVAVASGFRNSATPDIASIARRSIPAVFWTLDQLDSEHSDVADRLRAARSIATMPASAWL